MTFISALLDEQAVFGHEIPACEGMIMKSLNAKNVVGLNPK
jgi:hypothetical protein